MAKRIDVEVRAKGARKAGQALGGVDKRLKGLAKSAGLAAAAFFGARALLSGFKEAINLAGIQEQAEKKLAVALGGTSQALLDQAVALQQVTTFGDEAIIGVQASLAAFIKNEDQIKLATEATLDMAGAMGMDLKAAGDLVAKTLGSSTNAMSRYGIEVEGAVGSTERLESLTNNVAKLFGGQAKAQADTMAGSIEQMKNAVGDAAEAIGDLLAPTVMTAANALKGAAEFADKFLTGLKNLSEFGDVGGLEAVVRATDQTVIGYQNVNKAIASFSAKAREMGMDVKQLNKDALTDDEGRIRSARERLIFMKEAIEEELVFRQEKRGEHNETMAVLFRQSHDEEAELLEDIAFTEGELAFQRQETKHAEQAIEKKSRDVKEKALIQDLKQAALVQGSAEDAMKAVVRAEAMEAAAGLIASILKSVPFPANLILAAGAGAATSKLIDKGLAQFATGADFVTSGPQMMMVGEAGPESVQVTPLTPGMNQNGPQPNISVNISGGVVQEDYIRNELIPALNKATGTGTKLNA